MNFLFVIHYPIFGGPHNQAVQLNGPLIERDWHTHVVIPDEPGNAFQRLSEGGVETLQMPLHRVRAKFNIKLQASFVMGFWREVRAIRQILRERQIDLVLIGGLVNPHAAVAAYLEDVPIVWQIIDTRPPMILRRVLMPFVRRLADVVLCTGTIVAELHPGASKLRDRLIPFFHPVDTRNFRPDPSRRLVARKQLGVPEDGLLIGTVGNLNPQKGHEYLLRAASLTQQRGKKLFVRILGAVTLTHTRYAAKLRKEAVTLGLIEGEQLQFVDPGNQVAQLLPAFDIFLMSSVPRSEGIPTAILEAMACGLPVIATDVGGVREVVEEEKTGFVVRPLDSEALASALIRLIEDPDLRLRLGKYARERALERYDAEVCADTHVKAFETALSFHRKRKAS